MTPGLTLSPEATSWPAMLRDAPPAGAAQRRFRGQLALPTDRPIVMSGHQAGLWHAGIAAKLFAIEALADAALPVWLCVDQDDNDPALLDVPALNAEGRLSRVTWSLSPGTLSPRGTPTGARPAISPEAFPGEPHPRVRIDAIGRTIDALSHGGPTLARQFQHAASELLRPLAPRHVAIYASDLARTDLFAEIVQRMGEDPSACARAYNHAVLAHPQSQVRPLTVREGDAGTIELPLWRVRPGEARLPVFAAQLASIPREQLAPRALLMTALVRIAGCDLFIHGTGGGAYDRTSEDWIRAWLARDLAPMGVVSATLRLPLADSDLPDEREIHRRVALAHRARHDPAILGDHAGGRAKREIVRRIDAMRAAGENPAREFRALHDLLARARAERSDELARIEDDAEALALRRDEARLAHDRTWSFIFHDDSALDALARAIADALAPTHPRPTAAIFAPTQEAPSPGSPQLGAPHLGADGDGR